MAQRKEFSKPLLPPDRAAAVRDAIQGQNIFAESARRSIRAAPPAQQMSDANENNAGCDCGGTANCSCDDVCRAVGLTARCVGALAQLICK